MSESRSRRSGIAIVACAVLLGLAVGYLVGVSQQKRIDDAPENKGLVAIDPTAEIVFNEKSFDVTRGSTLITTKRLMPISTRHNLVFIQVRPAVPETRTTYQIVYRPDLTVSYIVE